MYEANKGELASRTPPSMALMEIAELAILVDVNDVTNSNSLAIAATYKRAATTSERPPGVLMPDLPHEPVARWEWFSACR